MVIVIERLVRMEHSMAILPPRVLHFYFLNFCFLNDVGIFKYMALLTPELFI
jgi:hypothetical protein